MRCAFLFKEMLKAIFIFIKKGLLVGTVTLLICEYAIYPIVIFQCSWPEPTTASKDNETLRTMFLADTHLLGPFRGHWFDKLRREWQMHRAFQTALSIFQPEVIFFLGDVFDEGNWVNEDGFSNYMKRFHSLFSVKENGKTRSFVVTGNHDMGFHYEIIPYLHKRFNKAFNTSSVKFLKLKGSNFLLLNSMAMEGDGCFLCKAAEKSLRNVSRHLACEENPESEVCYQQKQASLVTGQTSQKYSSPILLQHFPMYRQSDQACTGEDTAPYNEKLVRFRESYDCLSKESSDLLFKLIKPRLILSGHTHHHCVTEHVLQKEPTYKSVREYSVPSFSWRNRNDPSFYLAIVTPSDYHLSKCYLPKESTVYALYGFGCFVLLTWLFLPITPLKNLWNILSRNSYTDEERRKR